MQSFSRRGRGSQSDGVIDIAAAAPGAALGAAPLDLYRAVRALAGAPAPAIHSFLPLATALHAAAADADADANAEATATAPPVAAATTTVAAPTLVAPPIPATAVIDPAAACTLVPSTSATAAASLLHLRRIGFRVQA